MKLVRILNVLHYDQRKQRFTSLAFKNSTGGGISVIHKECVTEQSPSICQHIRQFYPPPTSSEPPIFWEFDQAVLADGCQLEQQTSPTGDVCHYNILNLPDKTARALIVQQPLQAFQICTNGQERSLQMEDLNL